MPLEKFLDVIGIEPPRDKEDLQIKLNFVHSAFFPKQCAPTEHWDKVLKEYNTAKREKYRSEFYRYEDNHDEDGRRKHYAT